MRGEGKIPEHRQSLADVVFLLFLHTHFSGVLGCLLCRELPGLVPPPLGERNGLGLVFFSIQHFSSTVSVIQHKSLPT